MNYLWRVELSPYPVKGGLDWGFGGASETFVGFPVQQNHLEKG